MWEQFENILREGEIVRCDIESSHFWMWNCKLKDLYLLARRWHKNENFIGLKLMCQSIDTLLQLIGRPQNKHLGCLQRKEKI